MIQNEKLSQGKPLSRDSFNKERKAIKKYFGLDIYCEKYHYYIKPIDPPSASMLTLMNKLAMDNLLDEFAGLKGRIVYEPDLRPVKGRIKEEEKLRNEKPELDVKKILASEDPQSMHIAALKYLFIIQNGKGMIQTLSEAIEFERQYLMEKSDSDAAKERIKAYDHSRILDHICREIQPTLIYTGIGRGLVNAYSSYGNLVGPFLIFRDAAVAKDGSCPYSDVELADIVKVMIKWICTTEIEKTTKVINALDKKNEKYKETVTTLNKSIQHYKDILEGIETVSYEYADKFPEYTGYEGDDKDMLNKKSIANKLAGRICKTYYGKALSKQSYKNLVHNIQQRIGVILNLFVDGSALNTNYAESNITELIAFTDEEKVAARKAAAQEKAETESPAEKAGEEGSKKE